MNSTEKPETSKPGIVHSLTVIAFLAVMALAAAPAAAQTWGHQAAVNYANNWVSGCNTGRYANYAPNDCANFVSQCLIAGGLDLSAGVVDSNGCIISCSNLNAYLVNSAAVTRYTTLPGGTAEPTWFLPGDVAIFRNSSGSFLHAVIAVTGDATHYATCAGHQYPYPGGIYTIATFFSANPTWTQCTYYHLVDQAQPASTHFAAGDTPTSNVAVNMRTDHCFGANAITLVPAGSQVQVLSDPNNGIAYNGHHWWKMQLGTYQGWCAGDDTAGNWWFTNPVVAPTITVVSPNGGETWQAGTSYTVSWSISGDTSSINYQRVALSIDGGATFASAWQTVLGATDRSFTFTPDSSEVSTSAIIRVRAMDVNGYIQAQDTSNGTFTINSGGPASPTAADISAYIDSLSQEYKVPAVVIKGLVQQESRWDINATNHESDGRVGMGLTQITLAPSPQYQQVSLGVIAPGSQGSNPFVTTCETVSVDVSRIQSDWQYNLEIGARWLVAKKVAVDGAGDDATVLENWYYPLAAYNGLGDTNGDGYADNDPAASHPRSVISADDWMSTSKFPYQECIYNILAQMSPNPTKNSALGDLSSYFGTPVKVTLPGPSAVQAGAGNYTYVTSDFHFLEPITFFSDGSVDVNGQDAGYFLVHVVSFGAPSNDTTPPTVGAFSVTPTSLTVESSVTISYTVSDTGGSELNRVELWRAPDVGETPGTWGEVGSPTSVSGNGPVSGSFSDAPAVGKWWYGIHVVDSNGNWNDEQNSRTTGVPDFGPIQVTVALPTLTISATLDYDWVYQNAPISTQWRNKSVLTISVTNDLNNNTSYTVDVTQDSSSTGKVVIEPTSDPLVWNIKGGQHGVDPVGPVTLDITVAGVEAGGQGATTAALIVRLLGDIDGDGDVDAEDKAQMNRRLNSLSVSYPDESFNLTGDLDPFGNPNIDANDKAVMNRLLNSLPIQ